MYEVHGSRISVARQFRGMSVEDLAASVAVTPATLRDWEGDTFTTLTNAQVHCLGMALDFPVAWFSGDEIDRIPPEAVSFRAPVVCVRRRFNGKAECDECGACGGREETP